MFEKSQARQPDTLPQRNLRTLLAEAAPRLRPAEQRVADFLLREGHRYADLSLSELASMTGVSQSAVVHMCKELGLSGFRTFRLLWVQEASALAAQKRPESMLFSRLYRVLAQTESMMTPNLDQAAEAIANASQVFVCGGRGSGLVAELAAESFAVAGRMAVSFQDDQRLAASYAHFRQGTALLIVSHRGQNRLLVTAADKGRKQGSTVIVVTSRASSALARLAHTLLPTTAPEPPSQPLATSLVRAMQVAVVHALVDRVSAQSRPSV